MRADIPRRSGRGRHLFCSALEYTTPDSNGLFHPFLNQAKGMDEHAKNA
jgi:hypothetical protein